MPHIIAGLTPEAASDICMNRCRAMCCRGPLILHLSAAEIPVFEGQAAALGVTATVDVTTSGEGWVRFSDHEGERCPMLEDSTSRCRIYEERPQRCRDFPEALTPGCAISGG